MTPDFFHATPLRGPSYVLLTAVCHRKQSVSFHSLIYIKKSIVSVLSAVHPTSQHSDVVFYFPTRALSRAIHTLLANAGNAGAPRREQGAVVVGGAEAASEPAGIAPVFLGGSRGKAGVSRKVLLGPQPSLVTRGVGGVRRRGNGNGRAECRGVVWCGVQLLQSCVIYSLFAFWWRRLHVLGCAGDMDALCMFF